MNFEIKTESNAGTFIFYTKANNGKDALNALINRSSDYNNILSKRESNNMTVSIAPVNKDKK